MESCAGLVQKVVEQNWDQQFSFGNGIWLANISGAPRYQTQVVKEKFWNSKERRHEVYSLPMANKDPITVKRKWDPGQQEYIAQDGAPEARNLFKKTVTIPPFRRMFFPTDIANWMLKRDYQQMIQFIMLD